MESPLVLRLPNREINHGRQIDQQTDRPTGLVVTLALVYYSNYDVVLARKNESNVLKFTF